MNHSVNLNEHLSYLKHEHLLFRFDNHIFLHSKIINKFFLVADEPQSILLPRVPTVAI